MTTYNFIGDEDTVFVDIQLADGSTLLAKVGQSYDLDADPKSPLLVPATSKSASTSASSSVTASQPPVEAPTSPANPE